jgi:hypothetical protein
VVVPSCQPPGASTTRGSATSQSRDAKADQKAVQAMADSLEKSVQILETAVDKASARQARERLAELSRLQDHWQVEENFLAVPSRIARKYKVEPKWSEVYGKCEKQYQRLAGKPELMAALKDSLPIRYLDYLSKYNSAFAIKHDLTEAVQQFEQDNRRFPDSLTELTMAKNSQNGQTYLSAKQCVDGWGAKYGYDRNGTRNGKGFPDIWSDGPPHFSTDVAMIGNWMDLEDLEAVARIQHQRD